MPTGGETEQALTMLLQATAAQHALVRDVQQRGPPPGRALCRPAFDLVAEAALAAARRVAADPKGVHRGAFVDGVVAGRSRLRVDIVCKSSGQPSPAATSRMKHFDRVFA